MNIYYLFLGYFDFYIDEAERALAATALIRRNLSAKINRQFFQTNCFYTVPFRSFLRKQASPNRAPSPNSYNDRKREPIGKSEKFSLFLFVLMKSWHCHDEIFAGSDEIQGVALDEIKSV